MSRTVPDTRPPIAQNLDFYHTYISTPFNAVLGKCIPENHYADYLAGKAVADGYKIVDSRGNTLGTGIRNDYDSYPDTRFNFGRTYSSYTNPPAS